MLEDVKNRLLSLGIPISSEASNSDDMIMNFSIEKVTSHIKNQTNLCTIPNGLYETAVDMVAGEFLFMKKGMGKLNLETVDFGAIAKQVQDGDTNVVFAVEASNTPEAKFDALVNYLRHNETDFVRYRVLTW